MQQEYYSKTIRQNAELRKFVLSKFFFYLYKKYCGKIILYGATAYYVFLYVRHARARVSQPDEIENETVTECVVIEGWRRRLLRVVYAIEEKSSSGWRGGTGGPWQTRGRRCRALPPPHKTTIASALSRAQPSIVTKSALPISV